MNGGTCRNAISIPVAATHTTRWPTSLLAARSPCWIVKERSVVMTPRQLQGRCFRLMRELATAQGSVPLQTAWLDRLANDLADAECEVAALRPVDDRRSGPLPAAFGRDKVVSSSAMPSLHST